LHFLAAGVLLFVLYRALEPAGESAPAEVNTRRVELTEADLRQLDADWVAQHGQHPTPEEMQALVDGRIRQEILYREALVLGLDQGDPLVKARLAEKMDFLAVDVESIPEAGESELRSWFARNATRFATPAEGKSADQILVPAFDDVKPARVKAEWLFDQREAVKRRAFEALKGHYEIVLPKTMTQPKVRE